MQIQSPFLKPDLIDEEYTSTGPSFPLHAFSPGVCPIGSLFSPNASDFSDPGLGVRPQRGQISGPDGCHSLGRNVGGAPLGDWFFMIDRMTSAFGLTTRVYSLWKG